MNKNLIVLAMKKYVNKHNLIIIKWEISKNSV